MKLFSNEHRFNHPWHLVSAANWKKYPNDITTHVTHVDYLDRHIDSETGILYTKRLITCHQSFPTFISKLLGSPSEAYVYEESEVNPRSKTLIMKAKNITMSNLMTVEETCTYTPSASDSQQTIMKQEASISSLNGLSYISNKIEDVSLERFRSNAQKGRAALEHVLERIKQETIHVVDNIVETGYALENVFRDQTDKNIK